MENENEKKIINCVDCNKDFELSEGWKKLLAENSDIREPKRCYQCRQIRKEEKASQNTQDW